MSKQLQIEEGKELLCLCRAGKLYEIEAWIGTPRRMTTRSQICITLAVAKAQLHMGFRTQNSKRRTTKQPPYS
jgi:hypothetical protein